MIDGTDIWLVSNGTDDVHFFAGGANLTNGTHVPTSSFDLVVDNINPFGITTDGSTLWVVNDLLKQWKTFVYNTAGVLQGSWVLDLSNKNARGITIDPANPNDILIVNSGADDIVFHYGNATNALTGSLTASDSFILNSANSSPNGLGGRIDIGAIEAQSNAASALSGDYNLDGIVNAADYTVWRDTLVSTNNLRANGDDTGASAGVVDAADYAFWKANFGNVATAAALSVPALAAPAAAQTGALAAGSPSTRSLFLNRPWTPQPSASVRPDASEREPDVFASPPNELLLRRARMRNSASHDRAIELMDEAFLNDEAIREPTDRLETDYDQLFALVGEDNRDSLTL